MRMLIIGKPAIKLVASNDYYYIDIAAFCLSIDILKRMRAKIPRHHSARKIPRRYDDAKESFHFEEYGIMVSDYRPSPPTYIIKMQ